MEYDRKMLEEWSKMSDWGDYLIKNGGLNKYSSKEGFQFLQNQYYAEVKRRISYCKKLLKEHEDVFLYYVIAELYDRCNEDESPAFLYKRSVRYYCLRAFEIDPDFTPAKELLQRAINWVELLGGDDRKNIIPDLNIDFNHN
jgi:hypothetical protein